MPHTVARPAFKYSELSEKAKDRVREREREYVCQDQWWDYIYDDATEVAKRLGIEFAQRAVPLMSGKTRYERAISFGGFSTQGGGACFEGSYRYYKGSVAAIKEHAPVDTELHRIAEGLAELQKPYRYLLTAGVKHTGRYNHSRCTDIDVDFDRWEYKVDIAEQVSELLRDFMDWLYEQLQETYYHITSDEEIDRSLLEREEENDYTEYGGNL